MIRDMSAFQKILSAIAVASLTFALCIGILWIRNQLAIHELQTRLRAADLALLQSEERSLGPSFPAKPVGLRLLDLTARSARKAGMEVASVRSSPVAPEQIGRNTYQATHVAIRMTGDINQIIAFLDLMEIDAMSSMTIDNILLKWVDDRWEVSLDVFAYTAPG